MQLKELYYPRAVAVIGSVSPGKLGAVLIDRLIEGGFKDIFAVNPKAQGYNGIAGFAALTEIDAPLDLIIIAAPATTVPAILEEAGTKGIKAAVIISSGFSEAGNHQLEEEIIAIAKKHGIRYIGPNCAGMVNTHHNLLPTLEAAPKCGNVSLISQSGAVGGLIMARSQQEGLGIAKFVSYGNGSDLSEIDLLLSLKDDPDTKVIAMYLENVRQGREFMAALKATTKIKPVIIVKSGRTGSGQRAALSHTGSLAGADQVYDAAFASCNAIRAYSIEELFDICQAFALLPDLKGRKLAVITNSGGPGVMAADRCEEVGLNVDEPSPSLKSRLQQFLPAHAGLANPLDITVEGDAEQYAATTKEALQEYDAALIIYVGTPYLQALPIAEQLAVVAKQSGKPIATCFDIGVDIAKAHQYLLANNLANFASGERAAQALSKMAAYYQKQKAAEEDQALPAEQQLITAEKSLLEPQAMDLLKAHGLAVPEYRFVKTADEAVKACQKLGYPVAIKIVSPQIIHKSDVGGVKLNIKDDQAAAQAFEQLAAIGQGKDFRGVIIYPMLKMGREVIMGFTRDSQFGPVIAFGLGGIYTEVLKDITLGIAPLSKSQALEMIKGIKTYALLAGVRGEKPADIEYLAEMLAKFSELPLKYPQLQEADLNPVFVYNKGAAIADARLILG